MMQSVSSFAAQFVNASIALQTEATPRLDNMLIDLQGAHSIVITDEVEEPERAYDVIQGVAIVPVQGLLVRRSSWWTDYLGMTGYDAIEAYTRDAVSDAAIRAVMLWVDSPGGLTSGCLDLADVVRSLRGTKPIWAICDDGAYSAAYAIASAADRITAPQAGGAGSIGVLQICPDISEMLKNAGIAMNMIASADPKTDGYPYAPMSKDARDRMQARIDQHADMFIQAVAKNRSISPAAVKATKAQALLAEDALAAGLIDAVATPANAFAALLASL